MCGNYLEVGRVDLMGLAALDILDVAKEVISLQLKVYREQFLTVIVT